MVDWDKRADKIGDVIENINELSTDFSGLSEKVQRQITSLGIPKTSEKEEKVDGRLLPSLNKLQMMLLNFSNVASDASTWFVTLRGGLERMATLHEKINAIKKEFDTVKSGGATAKKQSDEMGSLDNQLGPAVRAAKLLDSDLRNKDSKAKDLAKILFSYVQTYAKELSNIGRINSKVASSIGTGDTNKHLEKLVKALSDYASA